MKRTLAAALAIAGLGGLAACQSEPVSSDPGAQDAAAAVPADAAPSGRAISPPAASDQPEPSATGARMSDIPAPPIVERRFDIDAFRSDGAFDTIGAFNDPGNVIEWVYTGQSQPFAMIYRLEDVNRQGRGRTVLMVKKIGSQTVPGCLIAKVAGDVPDANSVARIEANAGFEDFDCNTDTPRLIGTAR